MSGDIHVVPHGGEWAIAIEGTGARTLYESREAAIAIATQLAQQTMVQLLVHEPDGQISEQRAPIRQRG
nr:DUF2188 domain-containing protein [Cupriavidus sp. BIS7]